MEWTSKLTSELKGQLRSKDEEIIKLKDLLQRERDELKSKEDALENGRESEIHLNYNDLDFKEKEIQELKDLLHKEQEGSRSKEEALEEERDLISTVRK